ncbi:hypothetical protein ACROYT_G028393 [Oculina patagonica]
MTFCNIYNQLIIRQANDVEENPGPTIFNIIDPTTTVYADYSQGNESLFGENAKSFSFTKKPPRTVRVLEGASKNLTWGFTASASQYFVTLSFRRLKIGDTRQEQIAARNQDNAFNYAKDSYKNDYTAFLPAKLLLKKVKRNEKYVYTIRILNEIVQEQLKDEVTVEVVGKYISSTLFVFPLLQGF